jgi:hypothetical protein
MYLIYNLLQNVTRTLSKTLTLINVGPWKFICSSQSEMRLFNLFALLELLVLEVSSLKSPQITISWELWNFWVISYTGSWSETNILSFNCKNFKTIGPFIHHYSEEIDILLLQEHWLFTDCISRLEHRYWTRRNIPFTWEKPDI